MRSILAAVLFFASFAQAGDRLPECKDFIGKLLTVDNEQVLEWKTSTPNQFKAMARVQGVFTRFFWEDDRHVHFEIDLSGKNDPHSVLEVVYNKDFGDYPDLREGMAVEACGEYITSVAKTEKYAPSPSGAIIHWVHRSTSKHPSGYLVMDGQLVGFGR